MISIVIPTLNEEAVILQTLERARLAAPGAELLVIDGGSEDHTVERASPFATVLHSDRGRGRQMNVGATYARGETLLFLHADTLLPPHNIEPLIEEYMALPKVIGGSFGVKFQPADGPVRVLERAYSWARLCGMFFGDAAIFVQRDQFLARGGFKQQSLMEDVELVRWMRRAGRVVRAPYTVTTSSRRFRGQVGRHLALWFLLHVFYYLGTPEQVLERWYPVARGPGA